MVAVASGGAQRGELVERSRPHLFGGLAVSMMSLGLRPSKRRSVRGQADAPLVIRDIRFLDHFRYLAPSAVPSNHALEPTRPASGCILSLRRTAQRCVRRLVSKRVKTKT